MRSRAFVLFIAVTSGLAFQACSNGDETPPTSRVGVNDVRLACETRRTWDRTKPTCSLCESAVIAPRCECSSLAAFSAACEAEERARTSACPESVRECVFRCVRDDCPCILACYEGAERCKAASDARDGCIGEVCRTECM